MPRGARVVGDAGFQVARLADVEHAHVIAQHAVHAGRAIEGAHVAGDEGVAGEAIGPSAKLDVKIVGAKPVGAKPVSARVVGCFGHQRGRVILLAGCTLARVSSRAKLSTESVDKPVEVLLGRMKNLGFRAGSDGCLNFGRFLKSLKAKERKTTHGNLLKTLTIS
jgi:hypothetical protein